MADRRPQARWPTFQAPALGLSALGFPGKTPPSKELLSGEQRVGWGVRFPPWDTGTTFKTLPSRPAEPVFAKGLSTGRHFFSLSQAEDGNNVSLRSQWCEDSKPWNNAASPLLCPDPRVWGMLKGTLLLSQHCTFPTGEERRAARALALSGP